MKENYRRTWAEVDLDIIADNFKYVKEAAGSKVCCVIKADAYGHGAVAVASEYQELGADFLAVSNIEEALQIRSGGITLPILILGYTPVCQAGLLAENNISQCVYSTEYASALSQKAVELGVKVKMHIKIDTGMSRLGFFFQDLNRDEASVKEIIDVCHMEGLIPEGIFTHFAVSDCGKDGDTFTMRQYGCFKELIEVLTMNDIMFEYRHCANSAATMDFPMSHLDMVRAGIILYGLNPSNDIRNKGNIKPAMQLKSVVSHVKKIPAGSTVSYGRTFTAEKDMYIATVPIGYADGYLRRFGESGAEFLIRGKRCPIVGRVCMDQTMVDVGDMSDIEIGEVVTIIGSDGSETISADDLAELSGTINYEILCGIGARVPRIYKESGKNSAVLDYIYPEHKI